MRQKIDRKDKKGRTILEETTCIDTIEVAEIFEDMQMLIYDISEDIQKTSLETASLDYIYSLQEICISILEKINAKII